MEQSYLISSPFAIYGPTNTVTQLSNLSTWAFPVFYKNIFDWGITPGVWLIKVHTYITFESTESMLSFEMTKTWGSSNSFGYSFWTILPFENPFGCNKIAKKIPNKLAHQVNQTKQAKQTHQPTRPTRTIRCNRPTRPTRTIKPAMEIFSQFHNSKFTPPKAAPNCARLGAGCQVIL